MFQLPTSLTPDTQPFLTLTDAKTLLGNLNTILSQTGFNPRPSNPWFFIAMFSGFAIMGISLSSTLSGDGSNIGIGMGFVMVGVMLPYILFFGAVYHYKKQRRDRLTQYVEDWNRAGNGVKLSFGGGGTTPRGVTVGSEFGGTYENFYMATWDPKSLMFRGYLHVFVNPHERYEWCRNNGVAFTPPLPLGQVVQAPPQMYQPPPGYALVPLSEVK